MTELNVIRLKNAVFYAYHGVMSDEQNLGGKYEVDVDMYCDLTPAAQSDSLTKTVDYEKVYSRIQQIILSSKFYLLEGLANAIGEGLLREFHTIERVIVRVRKPHPPVKGVVDHVEVEMNVRR
jgi:dihydroneopterin aldolase